MASESMRVRCKQARKNTLTHVPHTEDETLVFRIMSQSNKARDPCYIPWMLDGFLFLVASYASLFEMGTLWQISIFFCSDRGDMDGRYESGTVTSFEFLSGEGMLFR